MKHWPKITLFYLLFVALFGLLLRYAFISPGGFVFQYFKHTHSHVAFLGWVFNALFILVLRFYVDQLTRQIKWQFYLFQISILGMLLTFPFQGYAALSITFSTLHIFISIWFYFTTISAIGNQDQTVKWINLAAFYMVVSNIGPLALAPILILGLKDSVVYHLSLQHYLHFQYNGWFFVAAIGLIIKTYNIKFNKSNLLFWLLAWSVIPLFFSTVAIIIDHSLYRGIGAVGALAQLTGILLFFPSLRKAIIQQSNTERLLIFIVMLCMMAKGIFQLSISIPAISASFINLHNPIIGFLHLVFLGIITNLLVLMFIKSGFINVGRLTFLAAILFNLGFFIMVGLLFIQPLYVPSNYFQYLFWSSIPILIGVVLFNIQAFVAVKPTY